MDVQNNVRIINKRMAFDNEKNAYLIVGKKSHRNEKKNMKQFSCDE